MASVEPVHGGERTTAAGGVDTLTVLTVCQALCRVLCTYSPPSPLSSLQKAVCRTVRASALGAPLAQVQPECSCCCHHFLSCLPSGQALFFKKKKVYLFACIGSSLYRVGSFQCCARTLYSWHVGLVALWHVGSWFHNQTLMLHALHCTADS